MRFTYLPLEGAYLIKDEPFFDHRGRFSRIYCEKELKAIGLQKGISQINLSQTNAKGTIRGMHFQHPPYAECKIVRCLSGMVFDVLVDLRAGSKTFLKWHGEILTPDNGRALVVPEGFAHGFQVMEDNSQLLYFSTERYFPEAEGGILFNDHEVGIEWPIPLSDISEKDSRHPLLDDSFLGISL